MRQPTDLMRTILTDEMAQRIIDWIPPVYGDSYVGLHIIQAIGSLMGEVRGICEQLMYETTPATATLLLDQWEDQYGLPRDSSLTVEERRSRIVRKIQSRGPCNPLTLATAVSAALGGIQSGLGLVFQRLCLGSCCSKYVLSLLFIDICSI